MASCKLPDIPSLRRQQLRLEFASLRTAPPPGVYVSIAPSDPSFWSGVLFVQKGPYQSAILRFQIRFPPLYPDLPPLVTFTTDIFHPLIVPLTTYTFTTNSGEAETVSARDEERLPAGGFSLRHGFPHWFGRARKSAANSAAASRNPSVPPSMKDANTAGTNADAEEAETETKTQQPPDDAAELNNPAEIDETIHVPSGGPRGDLPDVPVLNILNYIRTTFDDEKVLDDIPLEAAGNQGAWHAWRTQRQANKAAEDENNVESTSDSKMPQPRPPTHWDWNGVWEKRVKDGIETSYLESTLFGGSGRSVPDDLIRFTKFDLDVLDGVKEQILSKQLPMTHTASVSKTVTHVN